MASDDAPADRDAIVDRIRSLVASATFEVTLSVPSAVMPELGATLEDAVDRGVLVLVLVWESPDEGVPETDPKLSERSTVARRSPSIAPVFCCIDDERGLVGDAAALDDDSPDHTVGMFDFHDIASGLYRDFLTNFWMVSTEVHAVDCPSLPRTYDGIRHVVTHIALCLRADVALRCRVEGRDPRTDTERIVEGRVLNVHQRMVYPASASLPVENSFLVDADGRKWVGGAYAFLEDIAADTITLCSA